MEPRARWRKRTLGSLIGIWLLLGLPVAAIAGTVSLTWDSNTEPDLAGYKVHIGTSSGTYTQTVDVGHFNSYTDSSLSTGNIYVFAVTAYDIFGNEKSRLRSPVASPQSPATNHQSLITSYQF